MIKILMICHGNICRSTMAEFVLQDMVKKEGREAEFYINSAGTSREEIGNPPHKGTIHVLKEHGVPIGTHFATQLTRVDYDNYDYLIGMDSYNIRNIHKIVGEDAKKKVYKLLDFTEEARDIDDPWYTNKFEKTYEDVVKGCRGLLEHINELNK
ncbi:MAG TPA: low molecular weight phosphotyrosine protein phosphatase [Candidatus Dorea intestinavium]|nr:low molecular weight phosphotyrosine protein phosphatase [Candidatus Dorea intestinavium]